MAKNIEIKAIANNFKNQRIIAEKITETPGKEILQEDVFFHVSKGRLKLRIFNKNTGELIYYVRDNSAGPKASNYRITRTDDPEGLKTILSSSLGVRGVVKKKRILYKIGNVRIHFDVVNGLGNFIELEYVMQKESTLPEAQKTVRDLMEKLNIDGKQLKNNAYIDMIHGKL